MSLPKNPENNDNNGQIPAPVPYVKKSILKKKRKKPAPSEEEEREQYTRKIHQDQRLMPVIDHIEELRWSLIRSAIWVLVFSSICMFFYDEIFKFVVNPIGHLIDTGVRKHIVIKVMVTRLTDYFIIQFKLTLIAGILFSIPAIIYEILRFILPALEKKYRKWGFIILLVSVALFWSGIYLAWEYMWDRVIEFLVLNWTPPGIQTLAGIQMPEVHLTMDEYLSFFISFHLTFGIACQMPIICVLLTLAGLLTSKAYFSQWRYVLLFSAVISAVITPPDVMSMIVMMVPLTLLYVISGLFVFIFEKRTK